MKKFFRAILMALLFCCGTVLSFSQNVYNSVSELSYDDEGSDITINSDFIFVGISAYALLYDGNNYVYVTPAKQIEELKLTEGQSIKSLSGYCMKINPLEIWVSENFYGSIPAEASSLPSPTILTGQPLTKKIGYVETHGTVEEDEEDETVVIKTGSTRYSIQLANGYKPTEYLGKEVTLTGFVWREYQGDYFIYIIDIWEGDKDIEISVSANPANGGSVWIDNNKNSTQESINPGSEHTINALANIGWHFIEWTSAGKVIGSDNSLSVYPNAKTNYVANFEKDPEKYTLSISANPKEGGTVSISGVSDLTSSFNEGTNVTVNAVPTEGYKFEGWKSDNSIVSSLTDYSFEIKQNTSLSAQFSPIVIPTRTVKFRSSNIDKGTVTADGYNNDNEITTSQTVILRANPVNDYHSFSYWTKNGERTNDGDVITYSDNADAEFVAYFTSAYPVTFSSADNGTISVTDSKNNIIKSGDKVPENDRIIIKLTPKDGYKLSSLTINSKYLSIDSDVLEYTITSPVNIEATFDVSIPKRTVYFIPSDVKKGSVIAEKFPNVQQVYTDEAVTIKAIPKDSNHEFDYWTLNDNRIDAGDEIVYIEPEEAQFIAYFKSAYPVTFTSPANGTISVKDEDNKDIVSGQRIAENSKIKIQLTPANGYRVTSLMVNDIEISHSSDPINYKVDKPVTISGKVEAAAAGTKLITVISSDNTMGKVYINTPGITSMSISLNGTAELHAEPVMGCKFEGWRQVGSSNFVSTDPVYTYYFAAADIHLEAVFNYIIQTPRKVTVVSSNNSKGTVRIKDEESNSVTSQRYLTLIATPLTSNDYFIDWTDNSGRVLSKNTEYVYDSEAEATITANFGSKYKLTYEIDNELSVTKIIKVEDGSVMTSGGIRQYSSTIAEGTRLSLSIETPPHYEIDELIVNDINVVEEYYSNDSSFVFAMNCNTQIKVKVVPQRHSVIIKRHPHGTVEVYRKINSNNLGVGSALGNGDRAEYGTTLYLIPHAEESYSLESVKINGKDNYVTNGKGYIEHVIEGDIEIEPIFAIESGISSLPSDKEIDEILMVFDLSGKYLGKTLPKSHGIYIIKTATRTIKVRI